MTDEELDRARAAEAATLFSKGVGQKGNGVVLDTAEMAARLAREGWTPEDPLLKEAREIVASHYDGHLRSVASEVRSGQMDDCDGVRIALTALKRGMASARFSAVKYRIQRRQVERPTDDLRGLWM